MGITSFILRTLFLCGPLLYSQKEPIAENPYITSFSDKISTRISLINTANSFYIHEADTGLKYALEPNIREYLGFSILFRSIEIDYSMAPAFLKINQDNNNSKFFNLNFRMFHNQWMQTFDLYKQKGFYFTLNDQKVNIPEVKTFKIGGSTSYIFNKNFSFRAIGFQNEWQTKSAGSFIPKTYFYYTEYTLKTENNDEKAQSFDLAISPSYYYNFVIKNHVLLSLGASTGVGLNHSSNLGDGNLTTVLYEFSGRATLGYNSNTLFAGINSSLLILHHKVDTYTRQDDTIPFLEFYIGYRFKAPEKLIKLSDDFNRKFGF